MKSKVSPRLLVPLGIALVLLLGFGALQVLGGSDEPSATDDAALPAGSDAAPGEEEAAPADAALEPPIDGTPIADGDAGGSDWASQANAICLAAVEQASELAASTQEEALAAGAGSLEISRSAVAELKALTPTPGLETEIAEFIQLSESSLATAEQLLAASQAPDVNPDALTTLVQEATEVAQQTSQLGIALGVDACINNGGGGESSLGDAIAAEPGSKGLIEVIDALEQNESVVVVVYSPSAELDNKVLREARAGANGSGAGFVAVNGTREGHVRLLAEQFDLRETPATLVVNSGLVVSSKFNGFADRETVAQAVTNAHSAS